MIPGFWKIFGKSFLYGAISSYVYVALIVATHLAGDAQGHTALAAIGGVLLMPLLPVIVGIMCSIPLLIVETLIVRRFIRSGVSDSGAYKIVGVVIGVLTLAVVCFFLALLLFSLTYIGTMTIVWPMIPGAALNAYLLARGVKKYLPGAPSEGASAPSL